MTMPALWRASWVPLTKRAQPLLRVPISSFWRCDSAPSTGADCRLGMDVEGLGFRFGFRVRV